MIEITDEEIRKMIDEKITNIVKSNYKVIVQDTLNEIICRIFDFRRTDFLYDTIELILNKEIEKHINEEFKKKNYFSDERLKEVAKRVADEIAHRLKEEILGSISYGLMEHDEEEDY